jgi:dephospho-CoA kinase
VSLVLGLTGPNAAGKGEVAACLGRLGFRLHSLSDVIRNEAAVRGLPPERGHLIRIGNELRSTGGPGVLAERILPELVDDCVVDSIRNPAEVAVLRRLPRFVLIGVTAPLELRFERARRRGRPGDPESVEAFRQREIEENGDDPRAQQLDATFRLADHVLSNAGELLELQEALFALLAHLGRPVVDRDPDAH